MSKSWPLNGRPMSRGPFTSRRLFVATTSRQRRRSWAPWPDLSRTDRGSWLCTFGLADKGL